jgi:hypothetical protein
MTTSVSTAVGLAPRSTRELGSQRFDLRSDARGAILVLGILLGAMLVSIVFHIASVGQAILWRENAQDAADAVAYEAALWNARGMNVIVALNVFLAVLIAILMFWRLLMLVVTIMLVLSGIACLAAPFFPVLGTLCRMTPRLANIVTRMINYDQRYTPKLYRAMTLIHRGQVIVASATPIISAVRSSTHVTKDEQFSNIKVALGVGFQLTPYLLYPDSPELQDSPPSRMPCGVTAANRKADQSGKILGKPVSLPMMHWYELDELCGKGATMQTKIADGVLKRLSGVLGFGELGSVFSGGPLAEVWSFIAEIMSPVLCESIDGSVQERFEEVIDKSCEKSKDRAKCEQDYRDESSRSGADKANKPKLGAPSSDDVLYAKTYWLATNGNLFMQSWGLVLSDRPMLESADKLIKFSDRWSKAGAPPSSPSALPGVTAKPIDIEPEAWVVAGAEMFFDCQKGWGECRYSSMWAMNWRARLRRFHDPMEYGSGLVETAIVESLWGNIDKALAGGPLGALIQKATGGGRLGGSLVGRFGGSQLHGFILSLARQELTERGRATTYQHAGIRSASSWALDQLHQGRDEIIH